MYKSQKGFTLIELVVVIVLLGILGVTAMGKFQDLSADATTAANSGVAAEISSAAAINYAASLVGTAAVTMDATTDTCTGAHLAPLFQTGTFPARHLPDATPVGACTAAGDTYTCQISGNPLGGSDTPSTATIICTGG
jgi:MSHA pilin protein MshA